MNTEIPVTGGSEMVGASRPIRTSWLAGITAFGVILLIAFWAVSNDRLAVFWDAIGFSILIGFTGCLSFAAFGWCGVQNAFSTLLLSDRSAEQRSDAIAFFRFSAAMAVTAGFVATLIGLIGILANLGNPSMLGPALAVALITQLYGVIAAMILYAAAVCIARQDRAGGLAALIAKQACWGAVWAAGVGLLGSSLALGLLMCAMGWLTP